MANDPKQICLLCRDTGYVTYTDDGCTVSAYCDCEAGDARFHAENDEAKEDDDDE